MSSMNSIKMMIFLWQLEIVDSLTLLQFCRNCGAQSTRLTLAEAAGYMGDIGPSVLLAPETQQILYGTSLFDEFKQQKIFFSYFLVKQADKQVDRNYYLFFS